MPNSTINATVNGLNSTAGNVATLDLQVAGSTVASVGSTGISVTGTVSATGVSSFPAGSNTAPSITFTGDTNTGIYSPAADTIAFTEGGVEAMRLDSSGNVLVGTTSASTPSSTGFISTANTFGFKNRIINGAMQIDQRNAGASVTPTTANTTYAVDRFVFLVAQASKLTAQRSTVAPAGFTNSLLVTSSSAYSVLTNDYFGFKQPIEGLNVSDLGWGAAGAKTVTLSFWVRSSLTGSFGGSLYNSAANRVYPFTYTISAANTFEYKSITVAGDTTGTWLTDNGIGLQVFFSLGAGSGQTGTAGAWGTSGFGGPPGSTSLVGTNGATWYITGVQLEVGTVATSFDYRPYGTELALCQRYFQKSYDQANALGTVTTTGEVRWQAASTGGESAPTIMLPVVMRTAPTLTIYSAATGASGNVRNYSTSADVAMTGANVIGSRGWSGGTTGFTAGNIIGYQFAATSEL